MSEPVSQPSQPLVCDPFAYESKVAPPRYVCTSCQAHGVRLYREYSCTFAAHVHLLCTACALKDQQMTRPDSDSGHTIGWRVAAVPTEEGDTYWGYTTVPGPGVAWWNALPIKP